MNKIKLLSRLQAFFNADEKKKKKKYDEIEGVIKKLKAKENKIKKMLNACQDEEMKKALQLEVNIIQAQIDKGKTVLNNL
jgi:protein subunit release factor A